MEFKVGDRVTLTGEDWSDCDEFYTGQVVTILNVDEDGGLEFVGYSPDAWDVTYEGWEVELNTDTPAEHFANTAAKFASDPLSTEDIEQLKTLGEQLGIASPPDAEERAHVRELLGVSSFEQSVRRHTNRIADVLVEKNKQYANSALDPIRVFSKADRMEQLRVRADDKLSRIRNGDTSEDSVLDLCGYLILMKIAEESA